MTNAEPTFLISGPFIWNASPETVRNVPSAEPFFHYFNL